MTDMTSREIRSLVYLCALDKKLQSCRDLLEQRLRGVPDLWRQYRLAESAMGKTVEGLLSTASPSALSYLQSMMTSSEIAIRPTGAASTRGDTQVVLQSVLTELVNTCIKNECFFCEKEGKEVKKCDLRKALLLSAPPSYFPEKGICPYAEVVRNEKPGQYL